VYARRDAGWAFAETTFTRLDSVMNPVHGGKRVQFFGGNGFTWSGGAWSAAVALSDTVTNATARSKRGVNHDGDSAVTVTRTRISSTQERFDVFKNGALVTSVNGPLAQAAQNRTSVCVRWSVGTLQSACDSNIRATTYRDSIVTSYAAGYSPMGDTIVLAVAQDSFAYIANGFESDASDNYIPNGIRRTTLGTNLYYIPVHGGTTRTAARVPSQRVEAIGISEDGASVVMQRRIVQSSTTSHIAGNIDIANLNTCSTTFARIDGTLSVTPNSYNYSFLNDARPCFAWSTFAP
jgi:hypothetical protein